MATATWNGRVLADSDDTVVVEGNHYFPPDAVDWELLEPSDTRSLCPWKGRASYLSAAADGDVAHDAAWTYRRPSPLARRIAGHVAFGEAVDVRD